MKCLGADMQYKTYEDFKALTAKKNTKKRIEQLARKYKNKPVVIYGAGLLARAVLENHDLSGLNITAVADNKFTGTGEMFCGYPAISPLEIADIDHQAILLATYNGVQIKEFLKANIFTETGEKPVESIVKKNIFELIKEYFNSYFL